MIQLDTKNQSFRQIMGNGLKYSVPRFQRDYSWDEEQWYDLWQDIIQTIGKNSQNQNKQNHYMGYLVLQSSDNKAFTIIDGQQRLTTISIIILAVLYELNQFVQDNKDSEDNKKRINTLKNSFIGFTDPVSLHLEKKLTLNRNNDSFLKLTFVIFKIRLLEELQDLKNLWVKLYLIFERKLMIFLELRKWMEKSLLNLSKIWQTALF